MKFTEPVAQLLDLSSKSDLVITQKSRLRESGLLEECASQILRCAQDDKHYLQMSERLVGRLSQCGVNCWRYDGVISILKKGYCVFGVP